jgi:hypothetical protein
MGDHTRFTDCTWFNVDFGPEIRFESGVLLHPFVGASRLIASDTPNGPYPNRNRWPLLPVFGISVGVYVG